MSRVALLLSGGMDSTAIAWWIKPEIAITIDYGQLPAPAEIRAARQISEILKIEHHVLRCDLSELGSGDLAGRAAHKDAPASEWWPYRNQMLLTLAGMKAIMHGAKTLAIGCLSTDAFHADGTRQFISSIDYLFSIQEGGLRVEAPAIGLSASELLKQSQIPIEVLAWAHSCHRANEACGECRGCLKHYRTMEEMGYDPF